MPSLLWPVRGMCAVGFSPGMSLANALGRAVLGTARPSDAGVSPAFSSGGFALVRAGHSRPSGRAVPRTPCPRKRLRGEKSTSTPLEPIPNRGSTPFPTRRSVGIDVWPRAGRRETALGGAPPPTNERACSGAGPRECPSPRKRGRGSEPVSRSPSRCGGLGDAPCSPGVGFSPPAHPHLSLDSSRRGRGDRGAAMLHGVRRRSPGRRRTPTSGAGDAPGRGRRRMEREKERTDRPRPHHAVVPGLASRAVPGNRRGRPREAPCVMNAEGRR